MKNISGLIKSWGRGRDCISLPRRSFLIIAILRMCSIGWLKEWVTNLIFHISYIPHLLNGNNKTLNKKLNSIPIINKYSNREKKDKKHSLINSIHVAFKRIVIKKYLITWKILWENIYSLIFFKKIQKKMLKWLKPKKN